MTITLTNKEVSAIMEFGIYSSIIMIIINLFIKPHYTMDPIQMFAILMNIIIFETIIILTITTNIDYPKVISTLYMIELGITTIEIAFIRYTTNLTTIYTSIGTLTIIKSITLLLIEYSQIEKEIEEERKKLKETLLKI